MGFNSGLKGLKQIFCASVGVIKDWMRKNYISLCFNFCNLQIATSKTKERGPNGGRHFTHLSRGHTILTSRELT
jgi:hypothetical protein